MKRWASLLASCAIAVALTAGCSSSATSSNASSSASDGSASSASQAASGVTGDATHGKAIFDANCAACHGAGGAGGGVGPVLKNEKSRKDYNATVAWIKNPSPPMPKLFPATLKESDVDDVAAYVQSL